MKIKATLCKNRQHHQAAQRIDEWLFMYGELEMRMAFNVPYKITKTDYKKLAQQYYDDAIKRLKVDKVVYLR